MPTVDVAYRLADFYGVSTDYILGREAPKEAPRHTHAGNGAKSTDSILCPEDAS